MLSARTRWLAAIAAVALCATGAAVGLAQQRRSEKQRHNAAIVRTASRILEAQGEYRREHGRFAGSVGELAKEGLVAQEMAMHAWEGQYYTIQPCGDEGYVLEVRPVVVKPDETSRVVFPVGCGAYPGLELQPGLGPLVDPPPPGSLNQNPRG